MPSRRVYLCIVFFFCVYLALHTEGLLHSNVNYRILTGSAGGGGVALAKSWHGIPIEPGKINEGDDLGPAYVIAAILYLSYSKAEISAGEAFSVSRIYFFLMSLPYLLILLGIFYATSNLVNKGFALTATAILLLARSPSFLSFSGDVYLFPVLGITTILVWLAYTDLHPRYWWSGAILCAANLWLIDLFRNSSLLLLAPVLLLLLKPRYLLPHAGSRGRHSAVILLGFLVLMKTFFAPPFKHPFWHSLHAGLFEFGGYLDEERKLAFPAFVGRETAGPRSAYKDRWDDRFQLTELRKHYPALNSFYGSYSKDYDEILKRSFLNYLRDYPGEVGFVFLQRVWRASVVQLWPNMLRDGTILFREPRDSFLRLFFWLPIFWALLLGVWRQMPFVLFAAFLPLAAPALLVHSGYVIYSFPFHLILVFLWLISVRFLAERSRT